MQLINQQVKEFQNLYKCLFKEELSSEEAHEKGIAILNLVKLVYQPINREDYEKIRHLYKEFETKEFLKKNNLRRQG